MAGKGGDILNKLIVAMLFLASIGFFLGSGGEDVFVLPGILFAVAGFVLGLRREHPPVRELEPELERRLAQLAENLAATHSELVNVQDRLERLTDEQDFMRQLAGHAANPRIAEPATLPRETPASPRAGNLAPPPG